MIQWIGLGAKMTLADPVEQVQSNSAAASNYHRGGEGKEKLHCEAVRRPLIAVNVQTRSLIFPPGPLVSEECKLAHLRSGGFS